MSCPVTVPPWGGLMDTFNVVSPVPLKGTSTEFVSGSLDEILSIALAVPTESGVKVTVIVHDPFGVTVEQLLVLLNSFEPVRVTELI